MWGEIINERPAALFTSFNPRVCACACVLALSVCLYQTGFAALSDSLMQGTRVTSEGVFLAVTNLQRGR